MATKLRYLRDTTTLSLAQEQCAGCGLCTMVCPQAVLDMDKGKAVIVDRDACMECGACAQNCPTGAIFVEAGVGCAAAVINSAMGCCGGQCCCVVETRAKDGEGQDGLTEGNPLP